MYEDMMKDVQDKFKPVVEMAEINKKAAETLFSLQSEYVTDFVNSCVGQMKALAGVKEPKDLVELQVKYFKDLESKLTNVAEKELAALTTAKEQIAEIMEKSLAEMGDTPYMAEFTKAMNDASEVVKQATESAVAQVTAATAQAAAQATPKAEAPAPKAAPKAAAAK